MGISTTYPDGSLRVKRPSASLRWGIVGAGSIGRRRAEALPSGALHWVVDLDPIRAQRLAPSAQHPLCRIYAELSQALTETPVDVVIVATYNAFLVPLGQLALDHDAHLLLEKPGALGSAELAKLGRRAEAAHRIVGIGYNHRFHPAILRAFARFQIGEIGPVLMVRGRYGHGGRLGYAQEWRANPRLSGGGELIDQGVHLLDLASLFLGEFVDIQGHLSQCFWEMPVEDNAFVSLRTAGGQTAWLHASCTEWKNLYSLEIYGQKGKLQVDGLGGSYGPERLLTYRMLPEMGPPLTTIEEFPSEDTSWAGELDSLAAAIQQKPSSHTMALAPWTQGVTTLQIVEELYQQSALYRR